MDTQLAIDWESLRQRPFDLLLALERRLRHARLESAELPGWTGLGFRLHERWFVVPRDDVREVSPKPALTRIPGARPWLLGIANVRGSLLPVTDLAQLGGLPAAVESRALRVLVLNSDSVPAGFLVDELVGERQFDPADQEHDLRQGAGLLEPFLLGAFRRDGRDWLVLSLRKLSRSGLFLHAGV